MNLIKDDKVKFIKLTYQHILKIKKISGVKIRLDSKDITCEKTLSFMLYFYVSKDITETIIKINKEIFQTYKENYLKIENKHTVEQRYVEELRNTIYFILNNIKSFNEDIKTKKFEEIIIQAIETNQLSLMSSKDIKV